MTEGCTDLGRRSEVRFGVASEEEILCWEEEMVALKTNLWRGLPAVALSRRAFVSSCQEEEARQTFQGARQGAFRQEAPRHEHAWRSDSVLRAFLGRAIPKEVLEGLEPDLDRFGERVAREVG